MSTGRRIVIVSADIGAGHDAAARELGRGLTGRGFEVDEINFLAVLPAPLHAAIRETYRTMLSRAPWSYDALFTVTDRSPLSVAAIRAALRPARRRMLARLPPDTVAVVTTFPFANQVLGPLRHTLRITAPVITYVTDFAVHPTWVAPGVELYCVVHEAASRQARANGATSAQVVRPLVSARFTDAPELGRRQARLRFGLPPEARLALIVAGSWGVGAVARTAREITATGCVEPVVVCGRNEKLRRRLGRLPGHVLGWVDDMPALMRAADVIVENAGGLTCQESLVAGLPTITYRPIPGHGRANAAVLTRCALTRYVTSPAELRPALTALVDGDGAAHVAFEPGVEMATVIADLLGRSPVAGIPVRPAYGMTAAEPPSDRGRRHRPTRSGDG
ncbi:MGDG synthase family glycosyltransferase [Micromonospora cathayae]|uniref:Glycosyltransferase n=1 Tax=Micromonospora cathayae TaxID=3028804 RepID=A0ABY7ZKB2_9ACTN|nr:glycosyltransferase [Micromonospora sp. HUAS 3]WDZ83395.1 glycosyltransferase [Micromonospora sp. HUAS 3]